MLAGFFAPERLIGVEVDGYRRLKGGYTRCDQAVAFAAVAGAEFLIANYSSRELPADVVTAWFPFVSARELFASVRRNLRPCGVFLMASQGEDEARAATILANGAGLVELHRHMHTMTIFERSRTVMLTLWRG